MCVWTHQTGKNWLFWLRFPQYGLAISCVSAHSAASLTNWSQHTNHDLHSIKSFPVPTHVFSERGCNHWSHCYSVWLHYWWIRLQWTPQNKDDWWTVVRKTSPPIYELDTRSYSLKFCFLSLYYHLFALFSISHTCSFPLFKFFPLPLSWI